MGDNLSMGREGLLMCSVSIRWCGALDEVLQNTQGKSGELRVWRGSSPKHRELIVFAHGYARTAADYRGLLEALQKHSNADDGTADVYAYAYDADPLSCEAPEDVVADLVSKLNRLSAHYQQIHLVGHSFGCLILRKAVLHAMPDQQRSGTDSDPSVEVSGGFAGKLQQQVVRMTLLAGTNRGFRPTKFRHELMMPFLHRWFWLVLLVVIYGGWCRATVWKGQPATTPVAIVATEVASIAEPTSSVPKYSPMNWREPGPITGALLVLAASMMAIWSAWLFSREAVRKWQLYALLMLFPFWAAWGFLDGRAMPGSYPHVLGWLLVGCTPLVVCIVARKFGLSTTLIVLQTTAALLLSSYMVHWPHSPLRSSVPFLAALDPTTSQELLPLTMLFLFPLVLHPIGTKLLIENALHGSAWITGIRLNWLETFTPEQNDTASGKYIAPPPIIHLFGAEDSLVAEGDHRELNLGEFHQVEIPGVKHSYFQMTARKLPNGKPNPKDLERYEDIGVAIAAVAAPDWRDRLPQLQNRGQQASATQTKTSKVGAMLQRRFSAEDRPAAPAGDAAQQVQLVSASAHPQAKFRVWEHLEYAQEKSPTLAASDSSPGRSKAPPVVVFLVHGIRDYGEWQEGLAARIREIAEERNIVPAEVVAVRYGYFSAFQFLFGDERLRATRSFLDLYAQTKASYPRAQCHVVAHSNGTYVVGMALLRNGFLRLRNLYLAGSVLSREFPWPQFFSTAPNSQKNCGQIQGVIHSDRAAWDWPVGNLCLLLGIIGKIPVIGPLFSLQHVGTGGVDGFANRFVSGQEILTERRYLPGDHGEALRPVHHESIARFLLDDVEDPITQAKSPMIPPHFPGSLQFQDIIVWRIRVFLLILLAVGVVAFLFVAMVCLTPAGNPLWPVLVSALVTLFVVRMAMAV